MIVLGQVLFGLIWIWRQIAKNKLQGKLDMDLKINCKVGLMWIWINCNVSLMWIWRQTAKYNGVLCHLDWLKFWKYISVRTSGHLRRHWQCKANATSMHLWPPNDDKDESDNDDKDELWNGIRTKSWKKSSGHGCKVIAPVTSQWLNPRIPSLSAHTKLWNYWQRFEKCKKKEFWL